MLAELSIRNFAIIDALDVSFGPGMNILTGETGAGKSIIMGAVSLLLGDRASADMIRSTADAATVEACFIFKYENQEGRAGMGKADSVTWWSGESSPGETASISQKPPVRSGCLKGESSSIGRA